jgi:hypothetical protein
VDRITLRALLRPEALARLPTGSFRFCSAPGCDVVYFSATGVFLRGDLMVPVYQKEAPGGRTICYCLAISEEDIRREVAQCGQSTAADRVAQLVRGERCACELRNPQGSCCLGNVGATTAELRRSLTQRVATPPTPQPARGRRWALGPC